MSKEYDPSGRFKIISVGMLMHPAACAVCGNGTCEQGYVDFGLAYDYEGSVYFCVLCAREIGEVVGQVTPEEVSLIQTIADSVAVENELLKAELDRVKPIADSVMRAFNNSSFATADGYAAAADLEDNSGSVEVAAKPVSRADGGESVSEEPTLNRSGSRKTGAPKLRDVAFE
jgi:hypothetical protein